MELILEFWLFRMIIENKTNTGIKNTSFLAKITKKCANLVFSIFSLLTFQIRENIKAKFT